MRRFLKPWFFCLLAALSMPAAAASAAGPRVSYIDIAQTHEYQTHNLYEPGQVLRGHVSVADATGSHTVALLWRDTYGRIAGADTVIVSPPVAAADFSIPLREPLSYANRIEATLDGRLQSTSADLRIRPPHKPWDDYHAMVWAGYQYEYLDSLRRTGINTHMIFKDFPYFEQVIASGFNTYVDNICWRVFAPYHKWRPRWRAIKRQVASDPYNTSLLVRVPSFEDPATDKAIKNIIQQVVRFHKPHRPVFFNLADEIGIGDQSGPIDFDHSIYSREAFIQYLKDKYHDIEGLNSQWDTGFPSFYSAVRGTACLTDAAMDRIWSAELGKQFGSPDACSRAFGIMLPDIESYVALNARLKSTPPKTREQIDKMLPGLKRNFGLGKSGAKDLVRFAEKFHQWTGTLDIVNPSGWNLSPWMDHKDFMDRSMARAMGKAYNYARQADPEGTFGFTGGHSPGAFAGYNLEFLSRVSDIQVPYNLASDVEIIRSLNKDMIIVSPTWGIDQKGVARLWYQFLHNDHGVIFWDNDESRHKFIEKADGSLTSRAKVFQPDLHELRGGLGKLILGSERLHDRIAVLYSHPSIRVHWMLQYLNLGREWILRESFNEYRELNFNRLRMALLNLIEDHFLQYDFISYVQLAQGKLDRGEYDLLFLPRTIVISDVEAAAIERFVERGGTVVADCLCGLMDESGKARPGGGALDKIFGFRSLEGAAGVLNRVSATVAETVNLGGVPALVNHYGRGKAIYLDRSISEYYLQRQEPGTDTELFSLFSGVFEASGISYPAKITFQDGSRLPGTELIRYRNGDRTVLSLHRNPLVRVVGVGGTEKVDNAAFEKVETVRLILPDTCHVYDLRKGKYLGHSDNFTFQFDPWRPSVLTLSSEKLAPPVVHPEDFTLTLIPGQPVVFELKLSPLNSTCSTRKNVVSVKVTGPDSRRLYHYEDNISFTGDTYRFTLSLAVNDQEGEYTVTFRDASTGFSTSIRLQTAK